MAKRAGWQNAFAFAGRYDPKTGELRKPAAQSYKMCVLYRGEWRLCQYRALKTKTSIETYELQPAEQLNQDNQAGSCGVGSSRRCFRLLLAPHFVTFL